MSGDRGTLEGLIGQLTILFSPLTGLTPAEAPKFFAELGLPLTDAQAAVIAPALAKTTGAAGVLIDLALQLQAAIEAEKLDAVIEKGIEAGDRVVKLISGFDQLKVALGGLGLPNASSIIATLPERLFNLLLARFFGRTEGLSEALQFAGVLERTDHNVGLIDPQKPFFTTNEFHFGRVGGWLTDPAGQLSDLYDWGKGSFDGKKILALLDRLAAEAGLPSLYRSLGAIAVAGSGRLRARPAHQSEPSRHRRSPAPTTRQGIRRAQPSALELDVRSRCRSSLRHRARAAAGQDHGGPARGDEPLRPGERDL